MFLRKKPNKSGSISVQILEKRGRINKLIKTIGCSSDPVEVERLCFEGHKYISDLKGQAELPFFKSETDQWFATVLSSIDKIELIGPELVLGKIFNDIGFDSIPDALFRHLVFSRIINPSSKLKTAREIERYYGVQYNVDRIYRYLDKISNSLQQIVQQISYDHTLNVLGGVMSIVFYDVTTIYFEAEREDELRLTGFSKEGKHKHPQILLGLLVSIDGYPLSYDIFPGNTYEGHTMLPVLDHFKKKYDLEQLIIVADSGLLSNKNITELMDKGYEFVLGARIKAETESIKSQILNTQLSDGQHAVINKSDSIRLIIHHSKKRAQKDKYNRDRGLRRLEGALKSKKLTKSHINNKGYNKYLILDGQLSISIDYDKYKADAQWDGLKGYLTNTKYDPTTLLKNYSELWKIEKAFRISKTDLKIRPIYHRVQDRIQAHICISFVAYKVYKELERQLKAKKANISISRAIEIIKSIQQITIAHPQTRITKSTLLMPTEEQLQLLQIIKN